VKSIGSNFVLDDLAVLNNIVHFKNVIILIKFSFYLNDV